MSSPHSFNGEHIEASEQAQIVELPVCDRDVRCGLPLGHAADCELIEGYDNTAPQVDTAIAVDNTLPQETPPA